MHFRIIVELREQLLLISHDYDDEV